MFINAIFWVSRTGAPWRDLPPDLGHWSNTHRRFIRWRDKGIWEKDVYKRQEDASTETAMIFGELYRHGSEWKFGAVGQGYAGGLSAMCNQYGIKI